MTRSLGPLVALLLLPALGSRLPAQDGRVVFERTGYRLTSLGGRVSVAARVLDGRRRAVPNAPIAWRIEDSAVAVVTPRGVVQSKRVGRTRLWAVSGGDSASALILVDQWAARFAFQPAMLTFGSMRETRTVQMQARDASGNAIPGVRLATACRILNPRVATLQSNGQVTASSSGVTWLRCTDRGVADSLRIEVRQRPATATIVDKTIYGTPRTVGDSFQVRMRAVDSTGQPIPEARPTWASLQPRVLNIDPLSGWARGVGVGTARVVAQLGDITDTVDVTVVNGAGMNLAPVDTASESADTATTAAAVARAELDIFSSPTAVGDTTTLMILPREASGALAEPARVNLRISGDTTIAQLTRDRRLVGLKEGQVDVVGTFGDVTKTMTVTIRPRGSSVRGDDDNIVFNRPSWGDTAAVRTANAAQADSAMRRILAGSAIRQSSGRLMLAQAIVAQASHGARLSPTYVERRSGIIFGGRAVLAPLRRLRATGSFRFGSLTADEETPAEDMQLTEVDAQLGLVPTNWLTFEVGGMLRAQNTPVALQRWTFATASLVFHPQLIGERFRTVVGFTLIPWGTLAESDAISQNLEPTSMAGDAGLEFRTGFFNAGVLYHTERISFPVVNENQRVDRFSMLRVRLGFQLGQ